MSQTIISQRTAQDIDKRIAKVLKDLDNPEPPLDLAAVRELLKLDLRYYSSGDGGILQEVIHQLRIGSQQVLAKPSRIIDAIRRRSLRALWVPERRRILIDNDLYELKKRWGEAHEISHSMIPHHQILTLGDPDHALQPGCRELLEAEANFGAGRLLFLQDRFADELLGNSISFDHIKKLGKTFGNTVTSTMWRTVETLEMPAVGLVSVHPWTRLQPAEEAFRHFIPNVSYAQQFSNVTGDEVFRMLARVVERRGCGKIGEEHVILEDVNGDKHVFLFECFATKYDTLSLGIHLGPKAEVVAVPA
ncbi:MAG: DUF955 domain-containing protein [Phycisphaerales bacterium]|nr:DUF955 domain-containing protein [Phycisphaerales bacterium]